MPHKPTTEQVLARANKAFSSVERNNAESTWDLLAEYITPNNSGMFQGETSPGIKRTIRLFDSKAPQANHDLAASIHSTVTNPTSQWSSIRFSNQPDNEEANAWMQDTVDRIHKSLNESNFDTMVGKNYAGYTSLGTMILLHEEMDRESDAVFNGHRFNAWPLSEVAFSENHEGIVDTVYRRFKMTARQAVGRFGNNVSQDILSANETNPEDTFAFMHCVFPRDKSEVRLNEAGLGPANKRPFASLLIEIESKNLVEEAGYYENPVYVSRMSTMPGEIYGRGPGHIALPEIRVLNRLVDISMNSLAMAAAPPTLVEQQGILGQLNMTPHGVTVVRDTDKSVRQLRTDARFDVLNAYVVNLQDSVKSIFFLDKLFLPARTETGEMTLGEVQERLSQNQKVLGPTISRLYSEFLTPLIHRTFKMMLRGGALAPIPDSIKGDLNIEVKFVNQLARAQQIEDITNMQRWVQQVAGLAQLNPAVLDIVNTDAIARETAKLADVPEIATTDVEQVEEIRQQRAQQQQQQQALAASVQAADVVSKTSGGNTGE